MKAVLSLLFVAMPLFAWAQSSTTGKSEDKAEKPGWKTSAVKEIGGQLFRTAAEKVVEKIDPQAEEDALEHERSQRSAQRYTQPKSQASHKKDDDELAPMKDIGKQLFRTAADKVVEKTEPKRGAQKQTKQEEDEEDED